MHNSDQSLVKNQYAQCFQTDYTRSVNPASPSKKPNQDRKSNQAVGKSTSIDHQMLAKIHPADNMVHSVICSTIFI